MAGQSSLDGRVPPDVLARLRHALSHDTSGTVPEIMKRTGCSLDRAIDSILQGVRRGYLRLLLQPNGECLIDLLANPQEVTDIIVDAEVNRINKGRTTIERDHDKARGATGKTTVQMRKGRMH